MKPPPVATPSLLPLLVLFLCLPPATGDQSATPIERAALLAFTEAATLLNWTLSANVCSWAGVRCATADTGPVVKLFLNSTNLSGQVPRSLADLSELTELRLDSNKLTGPVPPELANLKNLQILRLDFNDITGPIPPQLGELTSLTYLNLADTRLNGSIPSSLGNLTALDELHLDRCRLSGPLPPELAGLSRVTHISATKNSLSGGIPVELMRLANLKELWLSFNFLNGTAAGFERVKNLQLDNNCLNGTADQRPAKECRDFYSGRSKDDGNNQWQLLVGIFVPLCLIILLLAAVATWFFLFRPRPDDAEKFDGLKEHSYEELETATAGFNKSNLLGSGGFADVYLGHLGEQDVAVKLLRTGSSMERSDGTFRQEVLSLGMLQHVNLVRLLGYSAEKGRPKALVYEFVPMGTLKALLYGSNGQPPTVRLSFAERMDIGLQVAHGIEYCHHLVQKPVVHRDIKPANILMAVGDEGGNWVPKIADFGLAKSVRSIAVNKDAARALKEEVENILTTGDSQATFTLTLSKSTNVAGTYGYIDPEYFLTTRPTLKSDVYSYGMVLLELLLGRSPLQIAELVPEDSILSIWLKDVLQRGQAHVVATVERSLQQPVTDRIKCFRALTIAGHCLMEHGSARPTMRDVVRWLDDDDDGESLELPGLGSVKSSMARDDESDIVDA